MTIEEISAHAAHAKLSEKQVKKLFHLLYLPLDVASFPQMLVILRFLLSQIENMWPLELLKLDLLWMPPLVEKLSTLFPLDEDSRIATPSVEQLKSRNPLYCALIEPCLIQDEQLRFKYQQLLAHLLLANIKVMQETSSEAYESYKGDELWKEIEFSPYYACLTIRNFAARDLKSEELLSELPVHLRPAKFARRARLSSVANVDLAIHPWVLNWIRYIAGFVEAAHDLRDRRDVGERSRYSGDLGDRSDPNADFGDTEIHDQVPGDFPSKKRRLGRGGKSGNEREWRRKEALDADNCPEEDEEEDLQVLASSYEPNGGTQGASHFDKSPGSYRGMVRAMRNQVIRDNKNFAFTYERLMPFELARIEVRCRRHLVRLLQLDTLYPHQQEKVCDLALLIGTLWLGKNRARYITIIDDVDDRREVDYALVRPTENTPPMFRMHVEFPKYKWTQQSEPGDRRRYPYVLLPDYFDLAKLLLQIYDVQLRHNPQDHENCRIFPNGREQYVRLKKRLKDLDPSGRTTLTKISSAFSGYVMSLTGNDVVAAKMITGVDSRVSRVAMFYACRSQANINRLFHRCASWLAREIWKESGIQKEFPIEYLDPEWDSRYIGIRLCPTKDRVREAVSTLLVQMRRPEIGPQEYHNLLTLYTVLFFGYATLIRGIVDPLVLPDDISSLTHMALVRDKTSDSGDKAKYVFIPLLLKDHLEYYSRHLRRPDLLKDSKRKLFFYKEEGGFDDVRPSTIAARLGKFLSFPAAVHRRFSFNELIEAGCPPEVVRICMGHSTIGDEPWSASSTFSFSRYRRTLDNYITPLVESLGFIAVGRSPRRGRHGDSI